ncbi:MAG: DNA mismatch repair endonuclease MutL [Bacteroidia bacterium]|nr:DNA mismatch repair endonuclease MutL [Bacteroidia bacterium]
MSDVIQLLPENVANQIAAGEVIQRPASVVKELLENAIDANAHNIQVILKDGGKTLIQVIDDGCGMSLTDARMSFERHATSKIREANDLGIIRTMGFRGEALASIASIAHVELKTRLHNEDLGTRIVIHGSELKTQEACQCAPGTSFEVKHLFFNVPARRKFLKSDKLEYKYVLDEFQRIALAHPDIFLNLYHNEKEIFHLPKSNLRQRIVNIMGTSMNQKLVPLTEQTEIVKINGFIGKPEFAKKKVYGEQFFFVNNRYIKSGYLHHAIMSAYDKMLSDDAAPMYVIFIEIDPSRIDVNIHPTKQEIKFEDERFIYNLLRVSVKHALGSHNITPTLDFEQEASFNQAMAHSGQGTSSGSIERSRSDSSHEYSPEMSSRSMDNLKNWEQLYSGIQQFPNTSKTDNVTVVGSMANSPEEGQSGIINLGNTKKPYQIHSSYIISQIKSGFIIIDQQLAHERILYEQFLNRTVDDTEGIQKEFFPVKMQFSAADAELLRLILPDVKAAGFDIEEFGGGTFILNGRPSSFAKVEENDNVIEILLQQFKQNVDYKTNVKENVARELAIRGALSKGKRLTEDEMVNLIDQLFACQSPFISPSGRPCVITMELEELQKRFSK